MKKLFDAWCYGAWRIFVVVMAFNALWLIGITIGRASGWLYNLDNNLFGLAFFLVIAIAMPFVVTYLMKPTDKKLSIKE